jgi:hypothetical protein
MSNSNREIDAGLVSEDIIPKEKVVRWIESAEDIRALSKLYRLTRDRYYQIEPALGHKITCGLIQCYLLRCIEEDVSDDNQDLADNDKIEARWKAHIWFRHLLETGNSNVILATAARAVTQTFLSGSEEVRDAMEMGFLNMRSKRRAFAGILKTGQLIVAHVQVGSRHWSGEKLIRTSPGGLLRQIPKPEK